MTTMQNPEPVPEQNPKYCCECGYVGHCPHMDRVALEANTSAMVAAIEDTFNANKVYDFALCRSYDHKPAAQQMQGIHFAMMRYFGSGGVVGGQDSGTLLNYEWLEARRKQFPGR